MVKGYFKIIWFLGLAVCFCPSDLGAQDYNDEQHILASMRMVGHEVLLQAGDRTSRVLPIKHTDDNRYNIEFESDFEFNPGVLVTTIDSIFREKQIAESYLVAVYTCDRESIVYNYEMGPLSDPTMVPCSARIQPSGCFIIDIALLDPATHAKLANGLTEVKKQNNTLLFALIVCSLIILGGVISYFWKKRQQANINPNMINIGEYRFDKMNSELLLNDQKVDLSAKESDLLLLLYNSANTTLEREAILKNVWGDEGDYVGRTLDVFISKLRKKLEVDTKIKIVNIRGVGYKLVINPKG